MISLEIQAAPGGPVLSALAPGFICYCEGTLLLRDNLKPSPTGTEC